MNEHRTKDWGWRNNPLSATGKEWVVYCSCGYSEKAWTINEVRARFERHREREG